MSGFGVKDEILVSPMRYVCCAWASWWKNLASWGYLLATVLKMDQKGRHRFCFFVKTVPTFFNRQGPVGAVEKTWARRKGVTTEGPYHTRQVALYIRRRWSVSIIQDVRGRDGWDMGESEGMARKKKVPAEKDEWNSKKKPHRRAKREIIIIILLCQF